MINFEDWWREVGSGIVPYEGDDTEAHAHRVAREAWNAAVWLDAKMADPRDAAQGSKA